MLSVLRTTWPLLLGLLFLMIGNGLQGTLLGIRGKIEGFSTLEISVVMSAYFAGFLLASRVIPIMLRSVGHVRVFSALGSFISAVLILFPSVAEPWAWVVFRALLGFCFCGVYVTVESWLNSASSNNTRGQAMSLYLITQMVGIISAQGLLNVADPAGFMLFVIPSVLVSISFAPILLWPSPAPTFEHTKPMNIRGLFRTSPLGCIGMFLLGGIFACSFGMSSVFGAEAGYSVKEISLYVAVIYTGGLLCQYPIGYISDRMDRRKLVMIVSAFGGLAMLPGLFLADRFYAVLVIGFIMGGVSNPLYGLLIAYTNDFLDNSDMAAASAGMLFINGLGAIAGPPLVGWMMERVGPEGYFLFLGVLMLAIAAYAGYRMTRRAAPTVAEQGAFVAMAPLAPQFRVDRVAEPPATK